MQLRCNVMLMPAYKDMFFFDHKWGLCRDDLIERQAVTVFYDNLQRQATQQASDVCRMWMRRHITETLEDLAWNQFDEIELCSTISFHVGCVEKSSIGCNGYNTFYLWLQQIFFFSLCICHTIWLLDIKYLHSETLSSSLSFAQCVHAQCVEAGLWAPTNVPYQHTTTTVSGNNYTQIPLLYKFMNMDAVAWSHSVTIKLILSLSPYQAWTGMLFISKLFSKHP